ncbi:hypothetical protein MNBD_GAMMA01-1491 [hydrothermal vent metagenome]|uniref:Uncharacterized protein n=1 Tax=hydrothermal vent metagenome TaxID=652676 RepID=A0A3B0UZT8_9ZZZZ
MKLTEQQLAQMFKHSKNTDIGTGVTDLYASTDASGARLADVEQIANCSHLSASYQIINQLQDWSQVIGTDIELSLKPKFVSSMFAWLKPTLATAAIVTTVYFITPQINNNIDTQQQQSDRIMFTSSFDDSGDVIKELSFDHNKIQAESDVISQSTFS